MIPGLSSTDGIQGRAAERPSDWDLERPDGRSHRRLFRKYLVILVALVGAVLVVSGAVEIYFSFQENQAAFVRLQREKATAAAQKIEGFVQEIERQMAWAMPPGRVAAGLSAEQRADDYFRLLRQVPAITEVRYLDSAGNEQLHISRLATNVAASGADYSHEPAFREAKPWKTYFGTVYFRRDSEPYITIAVPEPGPNPGVTIAEVNLKLIWDVVREIRVGDAGRAYIVDSRGRLIAHPDIDLVLQNTDLSGLPQVQAALPGDPAPGQPREEATIARDLRGRQVLTAHEASPLAGEG